MVSKIMFKIFRILEKNLETDLSGWLNSKGGGLVFQKG